MITKSELDLIVLARLTTGEYEQMLTILELSIDDVGLHKVWADEMHFPLKEKDRTFISQWLIDRGFSFKVELTKTWEFKGENDRTYGGKNDLTKLPDMSIPD